MAVPDQRGHINARKVRDGVVVDHDSTASQARRTEPLQLPDIASNDPEAAS